MNLNYKKLRIMLIEKDMKQGDLAKAAGVSYPTIGNVCRGLSCSRSVAERIAEALGVPVDKLL